MKEEAVGERLAKAKKKFKDYGVDFEGLPLTVRMVILDMEYNMGDNFTPESTPEKKGWPEFFKAVKDKRWEDAANETSSSHIQDSRNKWRRDTILSMARADTLKA